MAKKNRTFLQEQLRRALFEQDLTLKDWCARIGYTRQQVTAAVAGKITLSHRLATAISNITGVALDVVQLTDGTLPEKMLKVCKKSPDKVLDAITSVK